jgi:competence protein ComEA
MKRTAMVATIITVALMMVWAIPALADDMGKVNINTATREQLMTLDGIGQSYADRIIEYRQKNGPFHSPNDIVKIKGIGQKMFEVNKDRIIVQNPKK